MAIKYINCPVCGNQIEVNTEEPFVICQNCGKKLVKKKKPEQIPPVPVPSVETNENTYSYKQNPPKNKPSTVAIIGIIIGVVIIILLIIFIIAVVYSKDNNQYTADQETTTTSYQDDVVNGIIGQQETEDSYKVKYKSSKIIKDGGKSYLIVNYIFTNNSEDARAFFTSTICEAYQEGVQLEEGVLIFNDNYDSSLSQKKIQPGKSIEVQVAFELYNTTSQVYINVDPIFSLTDKHYETTTIDLK